MRISAKLLPLALVGLALHTSATAAVIIFAPVGGIPIISDFAGVSVDLETGSSSNNLDGIADGDASFFFGGVDISNDADATASSPTWQPVRLGTSQTSTVANLAPGATVGPGSIYAVGGTTFGSSSTHITPDNEFTSGASGHIGFSMVPNAGGGPWYGWMRVTLNDDGNPGTIHEWAFDDSGAALAIAAIPEPGSAALALLGLGALALRRKRR